MDVIFLEEQVGNPTFHQKTNKPRQGVERSVAKSSDRCGDTGAQLLLLTRIQALITFSEHTERMFDLGLSHSLDRLLKR
jgi:hypothetical protein